MGSAAAALLAFALPLMASSVPPATVTVPGHYANFKEAIEKGESGIVVVEPGEHRWENFLEIGQRVDVHASGGTILPGSLWLKKGSGGEFRGVEMVKESGSCMIFEGGQWNIDSCRSGILLPVCLETNDADGAYLPTCVPCDYGC